MTPLEIVRRAQAGTLIDEDGNVVTLELPSLSRVELQDFADRMPCPLPPEITELLGACSGFDGTIDQVDFTGRDLMFELGPAFPHGLPIAHDGFGNFWVVDLHPHSTRWGPIYFVCHDAPVILYQSGSLEEFLTELFRMFEPPHESLIDDVHEDRPARGWRTNPGVLSYEECLRSGDPILSAFARELDETFRIVDLRGAKPGDGFSWGRNGPNTRITRLRTHAVFAYQKSRGALSPGSSGARVDGIIYNLLWMNTTRILKTAEEAAAILIYFNGFHDGFIKRLTLDSYDSFERWGCRPARGGWTSRW